MRDVTGTGYGRQDTSATEDWISGVILDGLGGKMNIEDVDCCAIRLRVIVVDPCKVREDILKSSGAVAVFRKGKSIQAVYGPRAAMLKSNLIRFMEKNQGNPSYTISPDTEKGKEEKEKTSHSLKADEKILGAHMNGKIIPLEEVSDPVFASGAMGRGGAIEPSEGKLFAPADGVIDSVFETRHAVGLTTDDRMEIFLHIGIDTVKLGGKYFEAHVEAGQRVKKGELLVSFDMDAIKKEGYFLTTPLIICNTDDYSAVEAMAEGEAKAGEDFIKVQK